MSQDLRDRFDDLVADVPAHVVPDARAAWAVGARRRTTRRVGVLAAVLAVLVLTAGLATWLPRALVPEPAGDGGSGIDGYPGQVVKPWIARDLPENPGPLAMVLATGHTWQVVDGEGHVWRVPQSGFDTRFPPALSADGRMLGYVADATTYVLRDLVSGEKTTFPVDTSSLARRDGEWHLSGYAYAFWSPDDRHLVVPLGSAKPSDDTAVVFGVDGSAAGVRLLDWPAGWTDDDTLAVVVNGSTYAAPVPAAELQFVALDGTVEGEIVLDISRSAESGLEYASIDPTTDRIAQIDYDGRRVAVFSTADGSSLGTTRLRAASCPVSWQGEEPVIRTHRGLVTTSGALLAVLDDRLDVSCVQVASDALAGSRHVGFIQGWFGNGWLAFHAREVAAGVTLGLVAIALLVVVRRRRRGRTS